MALAIDDPRLIESFRAGENEAFEALVRAHRPALYRHALRKLSDHAAAEDAVQETFMRAYKSRARVNDDWQLRPWLHQICANVCIDEANRRRKESTKASRWAIVDMTTRGIAPELEKQLGLDADHSDVTAAILSLPAKYQEALSMRYVEELEYDEIAQILDISEDNVRARVSRASKAVRVLLRPVAAIIAFLAVIFGRRGGKAAMAASVDASAAANTTTAATQMAHTASTFTPLIETAQAVAIQAPAAAPIFSKAAIGVTMIVAATAPVTAPVVIDQIRKSPAPVVSAPAVEDSPVAPAASVMVPSVVPNEAAPSGAASLGGDAPAPAASIAPRDNSASASKSDDASTPTDSTPSTGGTPVAGDSNDTDEPAPSTAAPVVRVGGALNVAALTLTTSGPRSDLSGSAALVVGDTTVAGDLRGRISLGTPDSSGRQRLDGTLTIVTADGKVEIRLTGYASPSADAPSTLVLSGLFRASGVDALLTSGSIRGSLGSALALSFSA
jgi:RNA polymerase sigma-70 factor (ECF subfamily)